MKFAEDTNNNNLHNNNVECDDDGDKEELGKNDEQGKANGSLKELSKEEIKLEEEKVIPENSSVDVDATVMNESKAEESNVVEPPTKEDENSLNNNSPNTEETITSSVTVQQVVEYYENIPASPTPKVRKNILTKENLLGSDNV